MPNTASFTIEQINQFLDQLNTHPGARLQYIGARYVPKFANPSEWVSTIEYEPLTIVQYQGNSYTSKQYVPIGIDINNTDYWANTGNYNAQIEQYRQEVQNISKIVDGMKQWVTLEMFGAVGDGITDDSNALKLALEQNSPIYLANKKYAIKNDVALPANTTIFGGWEGSSFVLYNTSLVFGGGDNVHINSLRLSGITFYSADYTPIGENSPISPEFVRLYSVPAIKAYNANYLIIDACSFNISGAQIIYQKVYDSRFTNCNFVSGGYYETQGNQIPSVQLSNWPNSELSPAFNNTNNIYFYGCRFEGYRCAAVKSDGDNNNNIFFSNCKFESSVSINSHALNVLKGGHFYFANIQSGYRPDALNHNFSFMGTNDIKFSNMTVWMWNQNEGSYGAWGHKYPLGFGDSNSVPCKNVRVSGINYENAPFTVGYEDMGCAFGTNSYIQPQNIEIMNFDFNILGGRSLVELTPTGTDPLTITPNRNCVLIIEITASSEGEITVIDPYHNTGYKYALQNGMNLIEKIMPANKAVILKDFGGATSSDNISAFAAGVGFNSYMPKNDF